MTPGPDVEKRFLEAVVANGPTGGGGRLFIDPERAQECIDRLRAVVMKLDDAAATAAYDLVFVAPGRDPISRNAAQEGTVMAQRAVAYVTAWRDQIATTVVGLEAQLAAYRMTEAGNRDSLL